jgi:WD40 repeat protein
MNSDGSNQRKLHEGLYPDWSPDGREIVFFFKNDIWIMDADSGKPIGNVTKGLFPFNSPKIMPVRIRWSPNGRKLLLSIWWLTKLYIYTMDIDGDNPINLTPKIGFSASSPCWSPDGMKIGLKIDNGYIHVIDPGGKSLERLKLLEFEIKMSEDIVDWRAPSGIGLRLSPLKETIWGDIKSKP